MTHEDQARRQEDRPRVPRVSRREALAALAGGAVLAGASGCSRVARPLSAPPAASRAPLPPRAEPITRLLNRASFGPRAGEAARVAQIGLESYVDEQLNPTQDDDRTLVWRLHGVEVYELSGSDLRDARPEWVLGQLQKAALLRAVYSRHQLRERMAELWSDHFNIYGRKWPAAFFKPGDEAGVVRQNALGKFPDLLRASARSPAMLLYLDNAENKRGVPNENYARELMELHTLGIDGGYTQADVREVARCFSGWTVEDRFAHRRGTFRFDEDAHDQGAKRILGHVIAPGGGESDAEQVLEILSTHPSTARFIAGKICRHFLGSHPHAARWQQKLAGIYTQSGGDARAMLRPLLLSQELREGPPILKRPFDFAASALRALNADTDGGPALQAHLEKMGQAIYEWPMPDGYPDPTRSPEAWSNSLLSRWNFALALAGSAIEGTSIELPASRSSRQAQVDALLEAVVGLKAHSEELASLRGTLSRHLARGGEASEAAALLMASPEFQWR